MLAAATGVDIERTLHLSTGIIGTRLPLEKVRAGLSTLVPTLSATDEGLREVAEALRTTDSKTKVATTTIELPGEGGGRAVEVTVSGVAKGVGMIHPRMATMLSVDPDRRDGRPRDVVGMLRPAAARTWDQLSVDGDTSTNDTVFVLASGAAGGAMVEPGTPAAAALWAAIEAIARDLARQQAADGEGANTLITAAVTGARDDAEARAVARSVISSSLVKAAAHGRDPNWGRIAGAAGQRPAGRCGRAGGRGAPGGRGCGPCRYPGRARPGDSPRISIAGHLVFDGAQGGPVAFDRAAAREAMNAPEVVFALDLGLGTGRGEAFGCDLTETYVIENSEYTT